MYKLVNFLILCDNFINDLTIQHTCVYNYITTLLNYII